MIEPTRSGIRRCVNCKQPLAADNTARMCARCFREQRDQLSAAPPLNSEFFETDDLRAAFQSQHIGRVFKAYRNHPYHLKLYGKALSQEILSRWLGLTQAQVSRIENGKAEQNLQTLRNYAKTLHLPQDMLWFDFPGRSRLSQSTSNPEPLGAPFEDLREGLTDVLGSILLRDASIDDMEQRTLQIGKATRFRSPESLVSELGSDLAEVKTIISRSPSEVLSRRLARVAAQMSGLMSLSLLKIDDRTGSRNWVRTARLLAAETNDQSLRSWVQAQEAYYHFYDKNLQGTVESAQYAQTLESGNPGVGSALAAAVEARAHALMGQKQDALRAIKNAEDYLSKLRGAATVPSAFGYNEAQFRFHQENALTRLGIVNQALQVQDKALALCPPEDFMDRALILLDRADCLVTAGDISSAVELVVDTVCGLESSKVQGLIANRARETLLALPASEIHRPNVLELRKAIDSLGTPGEGL